ncbi:DapH/DapD/GlmU-related protein [Oryzisolibacter sp. LB2S]|uniref:DapH/DapD/GlmU-related protein n=1 Tax=Alicycliphilus soli TaxID=3228789 RepID=UPI0034577D26
MNTRRIHKTAIIHPKALVGENVDIGPYAVIGNASIGNGSVVHSHAIIADGVELGEEVEVFPGALVGKEPKGAGSLARLPSFKKYVRIGSQCSIGPNSVIYFDVEIGNNTLIGDGASIREQCRIGQRCIISRYVTINYNTSIGDRTKIMDLTHITGNCNIGSDVFISLLVATTNDNSVRAGYGGHVIGPTIEDNVVVGASASILPGVRLGEGSTIGSGAVVTRDVNPNSVVVGMPARQRGDLNK